MSGTQLVRVVDYIELTDGTRVTFSPPLMLTEGESLEYDLRIRQERSTTYRVANASYVDGPEVHSDHSSFLGDPKRSELGPTDDDVPF